jgi:hypothetical protein
VCATVLGVAALMFIVGMTLFLSHRASPSMHGWVGNMHWHHSGPSTLMVLVSMVPLMGYLCFNALVLHRLFCNYKKGHIFTTSNTRRLVVLGLFNVFLCNIHAGLFCLVLAFALPDKE